MDYTTVIVSIEDKVGTITLNRPEANNTFNIQMATELNGALKEMDSDVNVNVIVINANGRNFCTGIDVNYVDGKSVESYLDWVRLMEEMNLTISNMAKPVIASVANLQSAATARQHRHAIAKIGRRRL